MPLKKSQKSLKKWGDQKWMTSGTHANKKKGKSKAQKQVEDSKALAKKLLELQKHFNDKRN